VVQPLTMVDNSTFLPSYPLDNASLPCLRFQSSPFVSLQAARNVWLFMCLCSCFCSSSYSRLSWLCHLNVLHHDLACARGRAGHPVIHRLLKPRSPDDCPACRLGSTSTSSGGPTPVSVRPWCEVTSRRGAPKRVNTEGFACPNPPCRYVGIPDPRVHALVGDGKPGRAEQIQTLRGPACRTTFTARRDTPLSRLKTPSQQVGMVLTALACGLDPSAAERVFGSRQSTITSLSDPCWTARTDLARALLPPSLAPTPPTGRACAPGCAALHRCCGCGWPAILAPSFCPCCISAPARHTRRTWSFIPCDPSWPPFCIPLFTRDCMDYPPHDVFVHRTS
jgi:hypothetical protein